ncbi:hypothetical protein CC78DRAFT_579843 [Lojkania enalia]|uniref:Uncharacterized protein n=1 Tax=Lojkania enalia TaxID=147567 RepID=A0A9P4KBZ9_9PLEO|nr:hypothetical protein CC78DRAFT_579843 [Didymosphaeria enalia]
MSVIALSSAAVFSSAPASCQKCAYGRRRARRWMVFRAIPRASMADWRWRLLERTDMIPWALPYRPRLGFLLSPPDMCPLPANALHTPSTVDRRPCAAPVGVKLLW